jgi:hypothetical protein
MTISKSIKIKVGGGIFLMVFFLTLFIPGVQDYFFHGVIHDDLNGEMNYYWGEGSESNLHPNMSRSIRVTTSDRDEGNYLDDNSIFQRTGDLYFWYNISIYGTIISENITIESTVLLRYEYGSTIRGSWNDLYNASDIEDNDIPVDVTFEFIPSIGIYRGVVPISNMNKLMGWAIYFGLNTTYVSTPKRFFIARHWSNPKIPNWVRIGSDFFIYIALFELLYFGIHRHRHMKQLIKDVVQQELNGNLEKNLPPVL